MDSGCTVSSVTESRSELQETVVSVTEYVSSALHHVRDAVVGEVRVHVDPPRHQSASR